MCDAEFDYSNEVDGFMEDLEFEDTSIQCPAPRKTAKTEKYFIILSVEDIVAKMVAIVLDVQEIIPLPSTTARILLGNYKWNRNQLVQAYFESDEDFDAFFANAKVPNPFAFEPICSTDSTDSDDCQVCYADLSECTPFSLECGHRYCKMCWNQYLTVKIAEEGLTEHLLCMQAKCKVSVTDEIVMDIVNDASVKMKYQYFMTKNFVQADKTIRWCPAPNCDFAVKKLTTIPLLSYECNCGETYCFECGDPVHEVVTCKQLETFKNHTDEESYLWIASNAKNCPGCQAPIEKNEGCNHMTCRKCRHEFCWLCMAAWRGHGACNRYIEPINTAEKLLARFNHYRDRFVNQMESLKMERQLCERIKTKANELQESAEMSANETLYLRHAVDTLRRSRRTLAFTYVFAYNLQRNNQVEIFEDNQADLGAAVERLSGYLERKVNESNVVECRPDIIDRFKYCSTRCDVLLGHIDEGKAKKWFQFSTD